MNASNPTTIVAVSHARWVNAHDSLTASSSAPSATSSQPVLVPRRRILRRALLHPNPLISTPKGEPLPATGKRPWTSSDGADGPLGTLPPPPLGLRDSDAALRLMGRLMEGEAKGLAAVHGRL